MYESPSFVSIRTALLPSGHQGALRGVGVGLNLGKQADVQHECLPKAVSTRAPSSVRHTGKFMVRMLCHC